jgi:hypothetical protein
MPRETVGPDPGRRMLVPFRRTQGYRVPVVVMKNVVPELVVPVLQNPSFEPEKVLRFAATRKLKLSPLENV